MNRLVIVAMCLLLLCGCAGSEGPSESANAPEESFSGGGGSLGEKRGEPVPPMDAEPSDGIAIVGEMLDFDDRPVTSVDPVQLSEDRAFLLVDEHRAIYRYFIDYGSEYLVLFHRQDKTLTPIMDLSAGFEEWNMVRAVMGPEEQIIILSHNELYSYSLAKGSLEKIPFAVEPDKEWPQGHSIVAFTYHPQMERYVFLLTERAADFDSQNKELVLATYNARWQQLQFQPTGAYAVADFFGVWSTPSLDWEDGTVSFDAFSWPFAKEHPGFFSDLSEQEKVDFITLAKENYFTTTFDLESGRLLSQAPSDPVGKVQWKFLY